MSVSSRRSAPHEKSTTPADSAAAKRGTGPKAAVGPPGCGSDLLLLTQRAVPDGPGGNRREAGRGTRVPSERPFPDGGPGPVSGPAPVLFADRDEGRGVDGHGSLPARGFNSLGCNGARQLGSSPGHASADKPGRPSSGSADDDGDLTLVLAVTVGATAAAFVLGGVGYVLWLLAQQPAVVLERVAAVVTLAVGFGAMVLGMERGR